MIVGVSRRSVSRRVRLGLQATVLAVLIFYVMPRLLAFFWQLYQPLPKFRDEQIWEKPLRVITENLEII